MATENEIKAVADRLQMMAQPGPVCTIMCLVSSIGVRVVFRAGHILMLEKHPHPMSYGEIRYTIEHHFSPEVSGEEAADIEFRHKLHGMAVKMVDAMLRGEAPR